MPSIEINFSEEINTSAQVGDFVYYIEPSTVGEFLQANSSNISVVGDHTVSPPVPYAISSISYSSPSSITIDFPSNVTITHPPNGAYIMFGKKNQTNMSGLVGYYAKARFQNNSKEKAELFSVGSKIQISSK
tara:strand:+ start:927 stop:1322 length:396 start_codon:yes stop_codon:yes gene_type:complete